MRLVWVLRFLIFILKIIKVVDQLSFVVCWVVVFTLEITVVCGCMKRALWNFVLVFCRLFFFLS